MKEITEQVFVIDSRYPFPPDGPLIAREIFTYQRNAMTYEERAAVIVEELNTYHKLDPVAWLAAVLRQFEHEIRNECNVQSLAMAAQIPDGED